MADESNRLTERARECLRLLYHHRSPEQIADELGISVSRVNQHFSAARAYYGVGRTSLAARKLAEEEDLPPPSHPVTEQESTVPLARQPRFRWPLRTTEEPRNDLTAWQILIIGFGIALLSILLLVLAGSVLETAQHMTTQR